MPYWACAQLENNRERLALHCLGLAGFTTYLPRLRVKRLTPTPKAVLATPALFPGYCVVLIELQWHTARWPPGVIRLVLDDATGYRQNRHCQRAIERLFPRCSSFAVWQYGSILAVIQRFGGK